MEYERNKKYFLARTFWFRHVGIALVALGATLFIIGYFSYNYYFLPVGVVLAVIGAVVGWLPSSGRASEKDVIAEIERKTEPSVERALEKTGLKYKTADNLPPQKVTGFLFDPENPYIRRGEDGHWRTSDCVCTVLIFTDSGVCAVSEKFSLVENENVKTTRLELPFGNFDGAKFDVEEHKVAYGKKVETVRFSRLVFTLEEKVVASIPAEKTANLEIMTEDMLRRRESAIREQK